MTCVSCEPKSRTAMVCGMSGVGKGRAQANALRSASSILGGQIRRNVSVRASDVFHFEGSDDSGHGNLQLDLPTRPQPRGKAAPTAIIVWRAAIILKHTGRE